MFALLRQLSWPELRHHPWRSAAALLAVMLGVALAFSVHLINQSALAEFSSAVRAVNGDADFALRSQRNGFDEALYERVAAHPQIALASPVVEIDTQAIDAHGRRVALRLLGIAALVASPLTPALMPCLSQPAERLALVDPQAVFLNGAARQQLGEPADGGSVRVHTAQGIVTLRVQGSIAAGGAAVAVLDIAGAQANFGWLGRLSRIDVRLQPGADRAAVLRSLQLPAGVSATLPDDATVRVSQLSRAYRANLTVLALVAMFTGAFLVFSILSLSVAKRQPQLALLGVLGMTARQRLTLVWAESALLGVAGSLLGLALGTALASAALRLLGGDLGGGYFSGMTPALQFSVAPTVLYGSLGVAAAMLGGWVPARAAQRLAPAQALKGLGDAGWGVARMGDARMGDAGLGVARRALRPGTGLAGPVMVLLSLPLALLPPIFDLPLAAYFSVAFLLLGGIACVPLGVGGLLRWVPPPAQPLALLALERARYQRHTATIAVAGVVASLSLAVALTMMVASFRMSVTQWLDTVLPADLYARAAAGPATADGATLPPALLADAALLPGVLRVEAQRVVQVQINPRRPAVALIARPLAEPARALPLVGELHPLPSGATAAYVSEAMLVLYGTTAGSSFQLPLPDGRSVSVFVRGVWRDYARQFGAVTLASADYQRLTADPRINDLALWLRPGADPEGVQQGLRERATAHGLDGAQLEFSAVADIRRLSLRIFDRSFAVTYWLQAVAIAIGLFGIAASFSAQVLARRKEFGLLAHLGLTRTQVLMVVAVEAAVWTSAGALLGLLLGLAVSVVLVYVVNPQSFHWSMDLLLPWGRLALLCAAVVVAGTVTAWLAARSAAGRQMVLAVKEDW